MRDDDLLRSLLDTWTDALTPRERTSFVDMLARGAELTLAQRRWVEDVLARVEAAPLCGELVPEPPVPAYCVEPEPVWSPRGCAERLARRAPVRTWAASRPEESAADMAAERRMPDPLERLLGRVLDDLRREDGING